MKWLYFVQVGTRGPIKIGLTHDPKKRLSYLQVGNHRLLRLIGAWPYSDREEERYVHHWLRGERIRGEWFRPTLPVLELAGMCA